MASYQMVTITIIRLSGAYVTMCDSAMRSTLLDVWGQTGSGGIFRAEAYFSGGIFSREVFALGSFPTVGLWFGGICPGL